ncbi:DUF1657 domain-containing protein [Siminovitchia sediminis]|uniref:DUF1657 domain-containing protein n=1 Tax=Siminovitchia sediminis TaxID=1274353 RepID=A0ABW4KFR7_9BACI
MCPNWNVNLQADLELFTLQTDSQQAKKMYAVNAEKLEKLIQKSKHLLVK